MESIKWKWVTPKELVDYVIRYPEKEVGFTSDTPEDVYVNGEPIGWYGIKFTKAFGGHSLIFGDYGCGVIWCEDNDEKEVLYEFWKNEFAEDLTEDRMICVDTADMN